jgi:hypothetical protein
MAKNNEFTQTFTLTFGDVAENHKGMQMIGNKSNEGFTYSDLKQIKSWFKNKYPDAKIKIIKLHNYLPENIRDENKAYVLIIKNGVNMLLDDNTMADNLYNEQDILPKDKKAFMYGRVVNKHARHNLCFSETSQEPNYEEGRGTIISFDNVPITKRIREKLGTILDSAKDLQLEGNYYYDVENCGIGMHGDTERSKVIGIRLGATIPLVYCWFHNNNNITPVINNNKLKLEHGDIYIMSEKATGNDWKKKTRYTLRHAAGAKKYITL